MRKLMFVAFLAVQFSVMVNMALAYVPDCGGCILR